MLTSDEAKRGPSPGGLGRDGGGSRHLQRRRDSGDVYVSNINNLISPLPLKMILARLLVHLHELRHGGARGRTRGAELLQDRGLRRALGEDQRRRRGVEAVRRGGSGYLQWRLGGRGRAPRPRASRSPTAPFGPWRAAHPLNYSGLWSTATEPGSSFFLQDAGLIEWQA